MRTHLGCTGRIDLGNLSRETQRRLEEVEATWLEFSPDPPSLVVRHVQPDAISPPREIGGELLELLTRVSDVERRAFPGGALYYLDDQTGQHFRLRVSRGGVLTVSWAHPSYEDARSVPYEGRATPVVFEPYQRLNGSVSLTAKPGAADEIRLTIERPTGLCPQGEYELHPIGEVLGLELREVNSSVVPLVENLGPGGGARFAQRTDRRQLFPGRRSGRLLPVCLRQWRCSAPPPVALERHPSRPRGDESGIEFGF